MYDVDKIEQNMDTFLQRYGTPDPLLTYGMPITVLDGCDKEGNPIYIDYSRAIYHQLIDLQWKRISVEATTESN